MMEREAKGEFAFTETLISRPCASESDSPLAKHWPLVLEFVRSEACQNPRVVRAPACLPACLRVLG